jgi:non-specific serine/threonine protein kinase
MDWSHDLLDLDAQRLLAELSVFTGGFTLEAVQGVGTGAEADRALELIERLAEASLVIVDKAIEPTRYRVLETVRQYGAERLESVGRTEELRERHSRHFAANAEVARLPLRSSGLQADWVKRLDPDRDNFRAALTWSLDHGDHDRALRIAEALWWYLWIHGELSEGRVWLERSLAGATTSEPLLRARGLHGLAGLTWALGDYAAAEPAAEEAMRLSDELGHNHQGGSARNTLGLLAEARGDFPRARDLFEAAIEKYRTSDLEPRFRQRVLGIAIDNLGSVAHELGDDEEARRRYEEARVINLELADMEGVAMNDLHLGILDAEAADWPAARRRLGDALALYRRVDFLQYAAECLEGIAIVANGLAAPRDAAFVLGAATHIRGQVGNPPVAFMAPLREREEATARAALGAADYDAARAEGLAAPIDVALERTLRFLAEPSAAPER